MGKISSWENVYDEWTEDDVEYISVSKVRVELEDEPVGFPSGQGASANVVASDERPFEARNGSQLRSISAAVPSISEQLAADISEMELRFHIDRTGHHNVCHNDISTAEREGICLMARLATADAAGLDAVLVTRALLSLKRKPLSKKAEEYSGIELVTPNLDAAIAFVGELFMQGQR